MNQIRLFAQSALVSVMGMGMVFASSFCSYALCAVWARLSLLSAGIAVLTKVSALQSLQEEHSPRLSQSPFMRRQGVLHEYPGSH